MRNIFLYFIIGAIAFQPVKAQNFLSSPASTTSLCNLSGVYSVGTGGNYVSLTAALDSIKLHGVAGNVVLELNTNYNSSIEIFPIVFPKDLQIPCLGNNKITVRPAAGTSNKVISGSSNNTILLIDSASYVIIDGRPGGAGITSQLSISNLNASPVIKLINASNNKILFTKFSGGIAGQASAAGMISFSGTKANGCDSNKLESCDLFSSTTPAARAVLFKSTGSSGILNFNDSIIRCNFYNFSKQAIYLENYNDAWEIHYNSFYNTQPIVYDNAAFGLKISSISTAIMHNISQNHFGGNGPGGSGTVMNIDYKDSFYFVDIEGPAYINSNYFTKINFFNTTNTFGSDLRMINVTGGNNLYGPTVIANKIGFAGPGDSIHITQNFPDYDAVFGGIVSDAPGYAGILNNEFNNIHAYSTDGGVSLKIIYGLNGAPDIHNNIIGNEAVFNSIVNHTNSSTFGIVCYNGLSKINYNTISRLTATSTGGYSIVQGINVTGGNLDSVVGNNISALKTSIGDNSYTAPLCGLSITPASPGGNGNLVADNHVFNLQSLSDITGGTVVGIHIGFYLNVARNFVHSLNSTASFTTPIYGILIPDYYSTLENNMVSLGFDTLGNSITAGNLYFTGISGGHDLKHNSVYIGGTNVADGLVGSFCYAFLGGAIPTNSFNNIFQNSRSNSSAASNAKHQCVNIGLLYSSSNSNLYYCNGTGGIIGTYQGTRYSTLSQWQAGTANDANSFFADPLFQNPIGAPGQVNLHLNNNSPAEGAGSNSLVNTDFDKEYRFNLTPVDIGADAGNFSSCPVANAGPDGVVFEGVGIQIGGSAANNVSYFWESNPAGFTSNISNPLVSPAVTTIYILTTVSGACVFKDSVVITVIHLSPLVLCPGGTVSINAMNTGSTYQWQADTGSGYEDISNDGYYSGTSAATLTLNNIPSYFYGYKYRCIIDGISDAARTLKFENVWTGAVNTFWNNAGNWSCGVIPDGNTDIYINSGTVLLNANGICRTLTVSPGAILTIGSGFNLTITH